MQHPGSLHVLGNVIRSFVLLALLFGIVFGMVYVGALLFESWKHPRYELAEQSARAIEFCIRAAPYVALGTVAWIAISLALSGLLINWSSGCRVVRPGTEPRLERILANLCKKAGMDVPKLGIIESNELNAFATGLCKSQHLVAVTEGLANRLTDEEIEAVMAHELAHIKHRDVFLGLIAAAVAGGLALLAEVLFFLLVRTICAAMRLGGGGDENDEGGGGIGAWVAMLIGFVFVLFAGFITTLVGFALSRAREYLADAGAVEMTGNAAAMASALEKISEGSDIGAPAGVMQLCIDRPPPFLGLFSTHPPIEERIRAVKAMRGPAVRSPRPVRASKPIAPVPAGLKPRASFGQR
ncbi:MAG: M48 family metalloprotease [Hyphomicrobiaceae bacterium]